MSAFVHASSGTVGTRTPLYLHCYRDDCHGRAKRGPDAVYTCQLSRGGCGATFPLTQFDVSHDEPKLPPGRWALRDWDPASGKHGIWVYEPSP